MALSILATITATEPRPFVINFHGWRGWLGGLMARGDRFARIGQSGSGTQIIGEEGVEKEIQAWIALTSKTAMVTACTNLEALKHYTHQLNHPYDLIYPHVTVRDVIITQARATKGPPVTGTTVSTHRVEVTLRLEVQPVSVEAAE